MLASASDDRSVRLWRAGPAAAGPAHTPESTNETQELQHGHVLDSGKGAASSSATLQRQPCSGGALENSDVRGGCGSGGAGSACLGVLRGHAARLWDVDFCGDLLVTGSEDRTVR